MLKGIAGATIVNSGRPMVALVIRTPNAVRFRSVALSVLLRPTTTVPKSNCGLTTISALLVEYCLESPCRVAQPTNVPSETAKTARANQRVRRSFTEGLSFLAVSRVPIRRGITTPPFTPRDAWNVRLRSKDSLPLGFKTE